MSGKTYQLRQPTHQVSYTTKKHHKNQRAKFGYTIEGSTLQRCHEEQCVIQLILEYNNQCISPRQIALRLNQSACLMRGRLWKTQMISNIICAEFRRNKEMLEQINQSLTELDIQQDMDTN